MMKIDQMILKRPFILLLAGLGVVSYCRAQHLDYIHYELLERGNAHSVPGSIDHLYEGVKGDPFYSEQWLPSAAVGQQGRRYPDLKLRVDLYKNIIYADMGDAVYDLSGAPVQRFILNVGQADSVLFEKGYSAPGLQAGVYVQVLAVGKLGLLKQRVFEIKDVHDESPLTTTRSFVGQDYYFLVIPGGVVEPAKPGKKLFEQVMGDKWKTVSQYAKEKDISFSKEEGWIGLLNFYNSIP